MKVRIADKNILINNSPVDINSKIARVYQFDFAGKPDIIYDIFYYKDKLNIEGDLLYSKNNRNYYKNNDKYIFEYYIPHPNGGVKYYTIINYEKDTHEIYIPNNYNEIFFSEELFFSMLSLDFILLNNASIIMHASVVEYKNEAVLFTGVSGVGKSTQAFLWESNLGAYVINGDRAFVCKENGCLYVFGSPYAGSSEIYTNKKSKIKAIVLLEQSDVNIVRKLNELDSYKNIYPRMALPIWDSFMMSKGLSIVDEIIDKVPIYSYKCKNDVTAVEYLEKYLFLD